MNKAILNISAYKFVPLTEPAALQAQLRARCQALGIKGTILLATEGMNLALAGSEPSIRQFMHQLREDARFADVVFKESFSDRMPFRKVRIRVKAEIIMMRVPDVNPLEKTAQHLAPTTLKQWLDEGRDVVMFDTRNDYELKVGTFENAYDLQIENFCEFPDRIQSVPAEMKTKPVVMFCTGGIRCEKATAVAMAAGFTDVYQVDGGILKYFEDCGGAHWQGECFVFDDRVALKPDLSPSTQKYCLACLACLAPEDLQHPQYRYNHSCPHCFSSTSGKREETRISG